MASTLQISKEQEAQSADLSMPMTGGQIPDYLKDEELLAERTNFTLSIIAVIYFLLVTIGPAVGTKFWLLPQLDDAKAQKESAVTEGNLIRAKIVQEERRAKAHEEKLEKIEQAIMHPANDRMLEDVISEIESIASRIALDRVDEGSYVTVEKISISPDGKVSFSGAVDSYITLANWIEALEQSPYLEGVPLTTAAQSGKAGESSVPYSFVVKFTKPAETKTDDADEKDPAAPDAASAAEPATPPSAAQPSAPSSARTPLPTSR